MIPESAEAVADRRIVVVEDEDAIRQNLREMLEAEGYEVFEAKDGGEAVRVVGEEVPDLVVCDLMLPVFDGFEVLRRVRAEVSTCHVPFLLLTAVADRETQRRGMEMGAEDYITKPFGRRELLSAVEVRLERSRSLQRIHAMKLAGLRNALSRALPHELLTPLNGILGLAGILSEEWETADRAEIRDVVRDIVRSGEQLHRLSARFLAYAELEMAALDPARRAALREESCTDPEAVARRVLPIRQSAGGASLQMPAKHLELVLRELSAWCGPFQNGRILTEGGRWTVELEPVPGSRRSSSEETDGSDLSSAIVASVCQLHGGRIDGTPDGGTRISFRNAQGPQGP
jgi:DNA-binding response OmpR family regulator